jgi:hypothetical protein
MDQGEYEGGFVLTAEARRAQSFLKHNGHEDHSEGSTFLSFGSPLSLWRGPESIFYNYRDRQRKTETVDARFLARLCVLTF